MGLFSRNNEDIFDTIPPVKARDANGKSAITEDAFKQQAPGLTSQYGAAKVSLSKRNGDGLRAAVYLVLDRSGSMSGFYGNGNVQSLAERVLAAAAHFDDDGTVPIVFFGSTVHLIQDIKLDSYAGRIQALHQKLGSMGSTNYAAAMRAVVQHYRKTNPGVPALVIFQTDGAPNSQAEAEAVIRGAAGLPIFWQFIGFGYDQFTFLRNLDEMTGRVVDNAGFFSAGADPRQLTDVELYDKLLGEYPSWVEAARVAGIVA
jgi:uncharacterized protein YegL